MSFDEGALLEPLSVGVHACRRAGVTIGKTVLVCGAGKSPECHFFLDNVCLLNSLGPIGLVNLLTAKVMGASRVCVTGICPAVDLSHVKCPYCGHVIDVDANRLARAKEMGADYTVLVNTKLGSETFAQEIVKSMGCMPDIAIECSGAESSVQSAIYVISLFRLSLVVQHAVFFHLVSLIRVYCK